MSIQISYKKQFTFGLILLLLLVGSIESGSRIYEFFFGYCGLQNAETMADYDYLLKRQICYDQQNLQYVYEPILTLAPNQHFNTININQHGFRGDELIHSNEQNFRIVLVGGSTIFGSGMPTDSQTIPYELEKLFEQNYTDIEVINAGISMITSFEELYHIKNKIFQLNPDVILVYNGANDVEYKKIDPEILETSDILQLKDLQQFLRSPVVINRYLIEPLKSNSDDFNSYGRENSTNNLNEQLSYSVASAWYERMNEFCTLSSSKQIKSIVVIQPTLFHGQKPLTDYEQSIYEKNPFKISTFEKISDMSKNLENCSLVLNFSDIFKDTNVGIYYDRVHLNYDGNKIVASNLYEKILPIISNDIKEYKIQD